MPVMEGNQSRGTRRKGPLGKSACWLTSSVCSAGFSQVQTHWPREGASHSGLGLHYQPRQSPASCHRPVFSGHKASLFPSLIFLASSPQDGLLVMTLSFICCSNTSTPGTAFSKFLIMCLSSQGTTFSLNHLKFLYNS